MKYLIPISYLSEACALSENIPEKKYTMVIKMAEEDLEGILGMQLFKEMKQQYDNGNMSADNDGLYEYVVKDYLAWRTYFHHLKFSQSESTPTGERQFTDENSTILDDVKLYSKEKNVKNRADQLAGKIVTYIRQVKKNTPTAFTLFSECGVSVSGFSITSIAGNGQYRQGISIHKSISSNE